MEVSVLVVAVVLSLLVGVTLGLLGGGGSILTLPILRYALGMGEHEAIALSLLVVGTTSLAALVPHALRRRVRWKTGFVFGAAGMLGAFGAGQLSRFVPDGVQLVAFGGVALVTAVAMMRGKRTARGEGGTERGSERELHEPHWAKAIAQGLAVGGVTGFVGAGGGFLVVPTLVLLGGLPMEVAVGTSLTVVAMQSFAGLAAYAGSTPVHWGIGASIAGAAVAGSLLGAWFSSRVSPDRLRAGFAWLVLGVALLTLGQEVPRALAHALANPAAVAHGAATER